VKPIDPKCCFFWRLPPEDGESRGKGQKKFKIKNAKLKIYLSGEVIIITIYLFIPFQIIFANRTCLLLELGFVLSKFPFPLY
jgi:hypothetical protein